MKTRLHGLSSRIELEQRLTIGSISLARIPFCSNSLTYWLLAPITYSQSNPAEPDKGSPIRSAVAGGRDDGVDDERLERLLTYAPITASPSSRPKSNGSANTHSEPPVAPSSTLALSRPATAEVAPPHDG